MICKEAHNYTWKRGEEDVSNKSPLLHSAFYALNYHVGKRAANVIIEGQELDFSGRKKN